MTRRCGMRKQSLLVFLLVLTILHFITPSASAEANMESSLMTSFVWDQAGILSDSERTRLDESAKQISDEYDCGVYIVTLPDYREYNGSTDIFSFSQSFYRSMNLGIGDSRSGVLLLLSMAERDYSLVTYGESTHFAFTDYGQRVLASEFLDDFRYNDWYGGFSDYLECSRELLSRAQSGQPLDSGYEISNKRVSGIRLVAVVGIPLLIAFLSCEIMRRQMKPVGRQARADEYIVPGGVELSLKRDVFLNRSVTRTLIRTENRGPGSSGRGGTTVNSGGFSGHSGKF